MLQVRKLKVTKRVKLPKVTKIKEVRYEFKKI